MSDEWLLQQSALSKQQSPLPIPPPLLLSPLISLPPYCCSNLSQIKYSLVVILGLNNVSEVQYKEIMISSINKNNCQDHWRWTSFIFILSLLFYFPFSFVFYFLFSEQLGLRFISHAVTSVTNWWRSHKTDHGTWENGVEDTRIKWRHTAWTIHADLM